MRAARERTGLLAAVLAVAGAACGGDAGPPDDVTPHGESESRAVSFERGEGRVRVFLGGRHVTTFHYGEQWDKPFLHPLRTPAGLTVSRGYPLEPREGEEADHAWHRGIWYGHGDVSGHDFWRELGRDRTGTIVLLAEPEVEPGQISAELGFRSSEGDLVGTAAQCFAFASAGGLTWIDALIEFRADQGADLRFGDTEDGGFAMRLADEFRQDRGAALTNSAGGRGTESIWGREARWVDYAAVVDGRRAGVAILDHPSNLRHPTRWHARGYSLCSANPFGLSDFTGNRVVDGGYTLPRNGRLSLRYRVLIHDGWAGPSELERWFERYAAATVGPAGLSRTP